MLYIGNGPGPRLSDVGGILIPVINDTGAPSIKGMILKASSNVDDGVEIEALDGICPIGVMYSDGVADGEIVFMTIAGPAHKLVEDGVTVTRGYWAGTSGVQVGRVESLVSPPAPSIHDQETGHFLESKASGTDVLALAIVHFR